MRLIGLTGNIASGKSTVMKMLRELGAVTVDADKLVHRLMEPGTPVTQAIVHAFGPHVQDERGTVNRKALAAIVFQDPEALRRLEAIVHPAVRAAIREEIARWRTAPNPPPAIVVEAVKLVESGQHEMYDSLWLVVADPEVQRQRLIELRGLSPEEAEARLAAQPPLDEKLKLADVVIVNNGSLDDLRRQVKAAWQKTVASSREGADHA